MSYLSVCQIFQMICGSAGGAYSSIFLSFRRYTEILQSRYFLHIIIVGPKESLLAAFTCTWTSGVSICNLPSQFERRSNSVPIRNYVCAKITCLIGRLNTSRGNSNMSSMHLWYFSNLNAIRNLKDRSTLSSEAVQIWCKYSEVFASRQRSVGGKTARGNNCGISY